MLKIFLSDDFITLYYTQQMLLPKATFIMRIQLCWSKNCHKKWESASRPKQTSKEDVQEM